MRRFLRRKSTDDSSSPSSGSITLPEAVKPPPAKPAPAVQASKTRVTATLPKASTHDAFRRNLEDPRFLHKYGTWLAKKAAAAELLLFWINAEHHRQELVRVHALLESMNADSQQFIRSALTDEQAADIAERTRILLAAKDPFAAQREAAFDQLFSDFYPRFLQERVRLAKKQGEGTNEHSDTSAAASWVVAAPERDSRQAVMMASERLLGLTGHPSLVGQSWMVLQGSHDDESSRRVRRACEKGAPSQELLLSFKADGTPWHHLLRSTPLVGKRGTLDGYLFQSWDVTYLVNPGSGLEDLLSDDLDEDSISSPYSEGLNQITSQAVAARLKRQEERHLPQSISANMADLELVDQPQAAKSTTIEVLRSVALRPPTSGFGVAASTVEITDEVAARYDAVADETSLPFLVLDKGGEYVTHADPALAPIWASGITFASVAERAATGLASRVRQAARHGQSAVMLAAFDLPGGRREAQFSLVPLLDSAGRISALCLSFLR